MSQEIDVESGGVARTRNHLGQQLADITARDAATPNRGRLSLVVVVLVILALPATVALAGGFSSGGGFSFDGSSVTVDGKRFDCPTSAEARAQLDKGDPCSVLLPAEAPRSVSGREPGRGSAAPTQTPGGTHPSLKDLIP